ncbi:response regulator transcription factor [Paenibacillus cremeus]|uniref:Response regulator n=1 Tax=Paenibacillus cremeus TaxID=2163881 RepID=A0A559KGP3_9BACL|nr:response regulator [Paenibacillus cremeus]TVY11305.1 response regulator [Paenibacillus cremeus]
MYTVLLVDDEIWSLEGLRKLFRWEELGFSIVGGATDAAEAFEIICKVKPDLIVTDIRMPEMSGIDLLCMTRKQGIDSEFVIVSGYAEFEYAKEALRQGAFDYQLKPIDPEEANTMLGRLRQQLDTKYIHRSKQLREQLLAEASDPLGLLSEELSRMDGDYWQVVSYASEAVIDRIQLNARFSEIPHLLLQWSPLTAMLIVNGGPGLYAGVGAVLERSAWSGDIRIGLSSVSDRAGDLSRLIRESEMAAANHFIDGRHTMIQYQEKSSSKLEGAVRKLEKWIMLRNYPEFRIVVQGLPELFVKEELGVYHALSLWNQVVSIMKKRTECSERQLCRLEFFDYDQLLSRFDNLQELCYHLSELVEKILIDANVGVEKQGSCNENFKALLNYVNSAYDGDLSLSELAEKFYINMTYCSELFKKVTGYTFSDYVTKLRMEKAAEMMESGQHSIDEISLRTGYHDYYYFNKIFKKFYGVTPSQFAGRIAKNS